MEIKFVLSQIIKLNVIPDYQRKLDNRKLVILDGAMGSELEKSGAKMDKNLWCGTCSVEFPELVRKVHEDYIEAGADVITTNTYASTPISMKNYGLEEPN